MSGGYRFSLACLLRSAGVSGTQSLSQSIRRGALILSRLASGVSTETGHCAGELSAVSLIIITRRRQKTGTGEKRNPPSETNRRLRDRALCRDPCYCINSDSDSDSDVRKLKGKDKER